MKIIQSPSPNFSGRAGYVPDTIVVHCTDGYFPSDMQYLQNPNPGSVVGPVSAHFVISPTGEVHQLVDVAMMAWHAGRVSNPSAPLKKVLGIYVNPNKYSIGIEVSLVSTKVAPAAQLQALKDLIKYLGATYSIPLDRQHVLGHHEIYQPKTCPGTINVDTLVPALSAKDQIKALQQQIADLKKRLGIKN